MLEEISKRSSNHTTRNLEYEHGELPTSMSQLTSGSHPYLKEKQAVCPSGLAIRISDGEAYVSK